MQSGQDVDTNNLADELCRVNERLLVAAVREQQAAERAERSSAQMSALLESLSVGVVLMDGQGEITMINGAGRQILGESGAIKMPLEVWRPDGTPIPREQMPFYRAAHGERFTEEEVELVRPLDGERRRVVVSGSALHDPDGRVLSSICVFHDVTKLRELERIREEYVALISHDLRSPLNIVTLFASMLEELLEQKGLASEATSAARIGKIAKRMSTMIQELQDSSRFEAGVMEMLRQPTDLAALAAQALDASLAPGDRRRVRIDADPAACLVAVDPNRIERAIANLVTNAVKYSPGDSPVTVRIEEREREVALCVIDRGPGVAVESLPKLFDRYFRASGVKTDGLGLGLYITRLIVEAHGGRVWVKSELGQGSTFGFALPLG